MARKKKEQDTNTETQEVKKKKDYSKNFISGNDLVSRKLEIIPFSPKLDLILGGGVPKGSFMIITGPEKIGKTVSLLHFAANCQEAGMKVYFYSIEHRLKARDLLGIPNLKRDENSFRIIESTKGNLLYAEDFLSIAEEKIKTEPNTMHILDSVSALCTESLESNTLTSDFRTNAPRLIGNFCKRITNVIGVNDVIVANVTHIYANQSGIGNKVWLEGGGTKIRYQVDVKLKATHFKPWMDGENQIGQNVFWQCQTSAIGPPGMQCESRLRYGIGIDESAELLDVAKALRIVKVNGSWYTFPNGEQAQGFNKSVECLNNDKDLYNDVYKRYKEMIG